MTNSLVNWAIQRLHIMHNKKIKALETLLKSSIVIEQAADCLDHNLPLRNASGVSSECMDMVYDQLMKIGDDDLLKMWESVDPYVPYMALLRHQIAFVLTQRKNGALL